MKKAIRVIETVVVGIMLSVAFAGCNKDGGEGSLASKGASSPEELGAAIAKAIIELDRDTLMSFVDESAKYDRALIEELESRLEMYGPESLEANGIPPPHNYETARKVAREGLEKELGGSDIVYSTTVDKPGSMRFSEPGMLELLPRVKLAGDKSDGLLLTNPLICRKINGKWVLVGKYP